jgi:sulfoxide reductase heme-binding subunit YedZ
MLVLAVTSNQAAMRRLGRRWQRLHRLVYVAAFGSVLHFWWWRNVRTTEPRRFAIVFILLLAARVWWYVRTPRTFSVRPAP